MDAVITMPLNPRHFKKPGFYSIFAYLEYLVRLHNLPSVLVTNQRGVVDSDTMLLGLASRLKDFSLEPSSWWYDSCISGDLVGKLIDELVFKGILEESEETIASCACGKIQYLSGAVLRKTKTSLISPEGVPLCCNQGIRSEKALVLVSQPLRTPTILPSLYPTWAVKEFDWIYSDLLGKRILLSRKGTGGFLVKTTQGNVFCLDNDVVSSFLPWFLKGQGFAARQLVSGISTMRQVALMVIFGSLLEGRVFEEIHFLPRVHCKTGDLDSLLFTYGPNRLKNALLWCAMSARQEISFDESLVSRMSNSTPSPVKERSQHRRLLS